MKQSPCKDNDCQQNNHVQQVSCTSPPLNQAFTDHRASTTKMLQMMTVMEYAPQAVVQRQFIETIHASPRMAAQRQQMEAVRDDAIHGKSNISASIKKRNLSHQAVQRKIFINPPKGPFAERTLRDLEKLVGGGSVIVKSNGELAMIGLEQDALTAGWKLLERMILNPLAVRLEFDPKIKGPKNKVDSLEDSRDPKKGSGSLVSVPLQLNMSDLVKTATGDLIMENTERHIILAHELIHADRGQRGKKAKGAGFHDVIGKWQGEVVNKKGIFALKEELETVGLLLAQNDPNQITENMIRAQLGKNMRAAYDEKGLQLSGL